jgi:hydrogenase-4 component H
MRLVDLLLSPVLRRRTVGYPNTPADSVTTRRTPTFAPELCTDQRACLAVCPTSAIRIESVGAGQRRWALDYGSCIFCAECIKVCPSDAIAGTDRYELVARDPAGLVATFLVEDRS